MVRWWPQKSCNRSFNANPSILNPIPYTPNLNPNPKPKTRTPTPFLSTEKLRILFERRRAASAEDAAPASLSRGASRAGGGPGDDGVEWEADACQEFLAAAFSLLLRYDALGGHGCPPSSPSMRLRLRSYTPTHLHTCTPTLLHPHTYTPTHPHTYTSTHPMSHPH